MAEAVDFAIAALAMRQHALITRAQLLRLGVDDYAIGRRVRAGQLFRVHRGVYSVGHLPTTPIAWAAAAALACGPSAVLSHGSAATLWGISGQWRRPFEVTVRSGSDRRHAGIRVHRSAALTRKDVRIHLGIRVTSPARTLLDIADRLTDVAFTRAVNDLQLAGYLKLPDLADLVERCHGHRGVGGLRPFVTTPGAPTRSEFEDAFVAFADRFGLPRPLVNVKVAGHLVDALFAPEQVIVELDGFQFHRSRSSFESDRDRDADTLAAGFVTVRITWRRLKQTPGKEAMRLQAILRGRRP